MPSLLEVEVAHIFQTKFQLTSFFFIINKEIFIDVFAMNCLVPLSAIRCINVPIYPLSDIWLTLIAVDFVSDWHKRRGNVF